MASVPPSLAVASPDGDLITSRRHALVRRFRALQEPRGRREQGLLLLEGTHLLQEVLRLGLVPEELAATPAWITAHASLLMQVAARCAVFRVSADVLAAMATTRSPDGVVLSLPPPAVAPAPQAWADDRPRGLWLALDGLQDPGNLGTLMRTALAAGVEAVWLAGGADPHQPKVLRASAGAALALPLWRSDGDALASCLARLRQQPELQIVASVPPEQGGQPYWQLDWCRPTVLLLGREGAGLAPALQALASHRVTVPHSAAVESLNVGVAAAPLLLERRRQQLSR